MLFDKKKKAFYFLTPHTYVHLKKAPNKYEFLNDNRDKSLHSFCHVYTIKVIGGYWDRGQRKHFTIRDEKLLQHIDMLSDDVDEWGFDRINVIV